MHSSSKRLLRCPDCHAQALRFDSDEVICSACGAVFPRMGGRPVLVRHDNQLFPRSRYRSVPRRTASPPARSLRSHAREKLPPLASNLRFAENLRRFGADLRSGKDFSLVLVVGSGTQREWLARYVGAEDRAEFIFCDVAASATVDVFTDAHELPFVDGVFDGAIAMAVLEHVMYPERVVAELHRVLAPDGLIYTEIPFIQQVHEGAYDFTRYTLSGHRRLMNHFAEIDSGMIAGPGSALAWSIENFVLAFTSRRWLRLFAKAVVRIAFAWLKHFDRLLMEKPQAMDGACATFFYGRRSDSVVPDEAIIDRYVGAKHLEHV